MLNDPAARPDGSYMVLYGTVAATADAWGQRFKSGDQCLAIAFQVRLHGNNNFLYFV